jgi:AcrR family transcriptional regulator
MTPGDTERRLLDAARVAIGRAGYIETSVDDIADEAGLTKGAVYRHFRSKRDVLIALMAEWLSDAKAELESSGGQPFSRVATFVLGEGASARWRPIIAELWRQALDDGTVRASLATSYGELHDALAALLGGWRYPDEAERVAWAALQLHDGHLVLDSLGDPRLAQVGRKDIEQRLRAMFQPRQSPAANRRAAS